MNLNARIRDWRQRQERETALSPRELDELEDHLRARTRLELELNPALTPTRAFEVARTSLGEAAAVSREFAKAGKPRWKKLLVACWALFAVSFLLPAFFVPEAGLSLSRPFGIRPYFGYEVFWNLLVGDGELGGVLAALSPFVAMVLTSIPAAQKAERWAWVGIRYSLSVVALGTLALGLMAPAITVSVNGEPGVAQHLGIGFWAWSLSYVCAAAALWIRDRDGASVRAKQSRSTS